jgi:hypothetical protein
MLKAIHAQESKKAAREKATAVVEQLRSMKLKEAAKRVCKPICVRNPLLCIWQPRVHRGRFLPSLTLQMGYHETPPGEQAGQLEPNSTNTCPEHFPGSGTLEAFC